MTFRPPKMAVRVISLVQLIREKMCERKIKIEEQKMKSYYLKKCWQSSVYGMTVISLVSSSVFAATSNCKNPVEVTLDGDVKM